MLFDLDGTLTDSRRGIVNGIRHAFTATGVEVDGDHDWGRYLGPPLRDALVELHGMAEPQADECVEAYLDYYGATGKYENDVYEGIPELLAELRDAGVVLGLATSKRAYLAEDILEHFGLRAHFAHVGGAAPDGTGGRKQAVVARAIDVLAGDAPASSGPGSTVVMVGDRHHDVDGAADAGIGTIGVAWGYAEPGELTAAGALAVVATVDELRDLLLDRG